MSRRPELSVVVPSRGGFGLANTLASLGNQSLPAEQFEVLVVLHGNPLVRGELEDVRDSYPGLVLTVLRLPRVSRAAAVQAAAQAVRADYLTVVDHGSRVSSEFLAALAAERGPGRFVLALVADVGTAGEAGFDTRPARERLARAAREVPLRELSHSLGRLAGLLLPTTVVRSVGLAVDQQAGEDALFWARLLASAPYRVRLAALRDNAVYYRCAARYPESLVEAVVDGHVSTMTRLQQLGLESAELAGVYDELRRQQLDQLNEVLRQHVDHHGAVVHRLRDPHVGAVDWGRLNDGVARDLAVLYVALPYLDTSALVAARRIREAEVLRDVLSSDMSSLKTRDQRAEVIWAEFVDQQVETDTIPTSDWWPRVTDYCRKGLAQIGRWQTTKGPYRSVYSRSMWPAAHLLAALHKARNPACHWTAEFSDPLLHNIHGDERSSSGRPDPELMDQLRQALQQVQVRPPDSDNLYLWIETLVLALADTVLFTNELQRRYMTASFPDAALAASAGSRSVVQAHPTLPRPFYELAESTYPLEQSVVNIGYFGMFYATRALTDVLAALAQCAPDERQRLRLHVFTDKPDEVHEHVRAAGIGPEVVVNGYVDYLTFLHLTTRFDVLLVSDAATRDSHAVNPYLPSKYSEYRGSGTPVWAVVETGSVLSEQKVEHRTGLGDVAGARAVLSRLTSGRD